MPGIIFALIILSGFSVFGAAVLNKRFEETIPVAVMGITAVLFLFYVTDIVDVGFHFVLALCFGCYVISLIYIWKNKNLKSFFLNFFTPGFLVFIFLLIIFVVLQRGEIVKWWDELRLWAAVPKSIFYTGKLQLGENAFAFPYMQSYPPGMSLFQFFWNRAIGSFSDFHLFLGYSVLGAVMMLEITKKLKWKQFAFWISITVILAVFPLLAYNSDFDHANYYTSLFIDPLLGMAIAYLAFQLCENIFQDTFHLLKFTLTVFFIINLKDSGILFSVIAIITAIGLDLTVYKNENKKKSIRLIGYAAPVASLIIAYVPWKILMGIYNIGHESSNQLEKNGSISSLFLHPNEGQIEAVTEFLKALFNRPLIIIHNQFIIFSMTFFRMMLFLLIFGAIFFFLIRKQKKLRFFIPFIFILVSCSFYIIGLTVVYANSLGKALLSYERYLSVVVVATGLFLLFVFTGALNGGDMLDVKARRYHKELFLLFTVFILMVTPMQKIARPGHFNERQENSTVYAEIIRNSVNPEIEEPRVFYVGGEDIYDNSLPHNLTYYSLIADHIRVMNTYIETNIIFENAENSTKQWTELLVSQKIDYVFFTAQMEEIENRYASMFPKGKYEAKKLYKVERDDEGGIALLPVPAV